MEALASSSYSRPAVRQRRISESESTTIATAVPGPLAGLRVHIIDAKLSNEINEPATLHRLAEHLGANVNSTVIEEADVIVTRIAALKRFQRHIDLDKAVRFCILPLILFRGFFIVVPVHVGMPCTGLYPQRSKNVVKPEWLIQCEQTMSCLPCNSFIAISSLYEDIKHPEADSFTAPFPIARTPITEESLTSTTSGPLKPASISAHSVAELSWKNRFSTHRLSPLTCPNQDLISELGIVRRKRELEDEAWSASAYQLAIAVGFLALCSRHAPVAYPPTSILTARGPLSLKIFSKNCSY